MHPRNRGVMPSAGGAANKLKFHQRQQQQQQNTSTVLPCGSSSASSAGLLSKRYIIIGAAAYLIAFIVVAVLLLTVVSDDYDARADGGAGGAYLAHEQYRSRSGKVRRGSIPSHRRLRRLDQQPPARVPSGRGGGGGSDGGGKKDVVHVVVVGGDEAHMPYQMNGVALPPTTDTEATDNVDRAFIFQRKYLKQSQRQKAADRHLLAHMDTKGLTADERQQRDDAIYFDGIPAFMREDWAVTRANDAVFPHPLAGRNYNNDPTSLSFVLPVDGGNYDELRPHIFGRGWYNTWWEAIDVPAAPPLKGPSRPQSFDGRPSAISFTTVEGELFEGVAPAARIAAYRADRGSIRPNNLSAAASAEAAPSTGAAFQPRHIVMSKGHNSAFQKATLPPSLASDDGANNLPPSRKRAPAGGGRGSSSGRGGRAAGNKNEASDLSSGAFQDEAFAKLASAFQIYDANPRSESVIPAYAVGCVGTADCHYLSDHIDRVYEFGVGYFIWFINGAVEGEGAASSENSLGDDGDDDSAATNNPSSLKGSSSSSSSSSSPYAVAKRFAKAFKGRFILMTSSEHLGAASMWNRWLSFCFATPPSSLSSAAAVYSSNNGGDRGSVLSASINNVGSLGGGGGGRGAIGNGLHRARSFVVGNKMITTSATIADPLPWVLMANADFLAHTNALQDFLRYSNSKIRKPTPASGSSSDDGVVAAGDGSSSSSYNPDHTLIVFHGYSLFIYTYRAYMVLGSFDESIFPAYGEDVEMYYRAASLGLTFDFYDADSRQYSHMGSASGQNTKVSDMIVRWARDEYLRQKWGVNMFSGGADGKRSWDEISLGDYHPSAASADGGGGGGGASAATIIPKADQPLYYYPWNMAAIPHRSSYAVDKRHVDCVKGRAMGAPASAVASAAEGAVGHHHDYYPNSTMKCFWHGTVIVQLMPRVEEATDLDRGGSTENKDSAGPADDDGTENTAGDDDDGFNHGAHNSDKRRYRTLPSVFTAIRKWNI